MSNLLKRILFAVPAAAFAIFITWLGGWYFVATVIMLVLVIQYEVKIIAEKAGFKPDNYFPYTIALWILLAPALPHAFELGIAIFLLFVAIQVFKNHDKHIQEFISTIFCGGYAPFGLLFLILLRQTGSSETGFVLMVSLFLMIWGNDVLAYFGGKYLGRRLLAPVISPKKTWEGFFFGFLGAGIGFWVTLVLVPFEYPVSWLQMIPAIILISIFSPLGDLAESKLKRAAQVKDASNILPGHGGFFDRFDGFILAAPVFYVYLQYLQIYGYASL